MSDCRASRSPVIARKSDDPAIDGCFLLDQRTLRPVRTSEVYSIVSLYLAVARHDVRSRWFPLILRIQSVGSELAEVRLYTSNIVVQRWVSITFDDMHLQT